MSLSIAASCTSGGTQPADGGDSDASNGQDPAAGVVDADATDAGHSATQPEVGSEAGDSATPLVTLPEGSREHAGVLNLVDEDAAVELEYALGQGGGLTAEQAQGMVVPTNRFLELYEEVYDFVYFITEQDFESGAAGRFVTVNKVTSPGGAGTGSRPAGYRTDGRLKGVAVIAYGDDPRDYGPFGHEMLHYWAAFLDSSFGFGLSKDIHYGPHWGLSDVHGQLGGFDGETLRCNEPTGVLPPGCTPELSGRVRYRVANFATAGARHDDFAPLELYLMGLLPAYQVPANFRVLQEGEIIEWDSADETYLLEADGVAEVAFSEILDRYGEVAPAEETAFRSAFVVVSREPVPDDQLNKVADWAAAFGNRYDGIQDWAAFEDSAQGLATMDTRLGPRRSVDDVPPEPRPEFYCDVAAQDCPSDLEGCYGLVRSVCVLSGGTPGGQACDPDQQFGCAPGFECIDDGAGGASVCSPFCDPADASAAQACDTLCPNRYVAGTHEMLEVRRALCIPE